MATSSIFITAADARQNPIRERIVFDEGTAISSAILESVRTGYYSALIDGGTVMTQNAAVISSVYSINNDTSTFNIGAHTLNTADAVYVYSLGELPSPLQVNTLYYVIYVDSNNIKLAATKKDALASRPIYVTLASGVTAITLTDQGNGYTSQPTVTLTGGNATVEATAVAYLASYGDVSYIVVGSQGANYHYPPTVTISAQGSGAAAGTIAYNVASAVVAAGGQYYSVGDILSIVGGTGTSATATVTSVDTNGAVLSIALLNAGNYSVMPMLVNVATTVLPGGGVNCTLNLNMGITSITVSSGGSQYTAPPLVQITGGNGTGAAAYAVLTAGTVSNIVITESGTGYSAIPTVTITSGTGATAVPYLAPTSVGNIYLLTNGGSTYTLPPAVTITAAGSGATVSSVSMRITSATLSTGGAGSGYSVGDTLIVAGGAGSDTATIRVNVVDSAGSIVAWTLMTSGSYTTLPVMTNNAVYGGNGEAASFNLTAGLGSVSLSSGGSGYTAAPTVVITPNDITGVGAMAYSILSGDSVSEIAVTASGTGYTAPPTVTVTSGSGATAEATLTATGVQFVNVSNVGSGYTSATVSFVSEHGAGAVATATVSAGEVVSITVTNAGYGYTLPPTVIIDGDGNGAEATAQLIATSVDYLSLTAMGENYTSCPDVSIAGTATGNVSLYGTGVEQILVTNGGDFYTSNPQVNVIPGAGEFAVPLAPTTSVLRGFSVAAIEVVNQGSGYDTAPTVTISSPEYIGGNVATATSEIGYGQGTMTISQYPASRDYWLVWQNGQTVNADLTRPYADQMDTVIAYFTNLGYTITRQTNPATNNTLQWSVKW